MMKSFPFVSVCWRRRSISAVITWFRSDDEIVSVCQRVLASTVYFCCDHVLSILGKTGRSSAAAVLQSSPGLLRHACITVVKSCLLLHPIDLAAWVTSFAKRTKVW